MLNNYFKIASRNIAKRKLYSFINAFGLSIGIAFCMLIYLFIQDERSFDQFHANKDQLYRMHGVMYKGDRAKNANESLFEKIPMMQLGLVSALKAEVPEVNYATTFCKNHELLRYEDKVFNEEIAYVDADFFSMFSFGLLKGNKDKLFLTKDEIVLTPMMAEKYFGTTDVVGEVIMIGTRPLTVTGVIASPPANSSLQFQALLPVQGWGAYNPHNLSKWMNLGFPAFVQLHENTSTQSFQSNLDKLTQKYMSEELVKWSEREKVPAEYAAYQMGFTNIKDIHLQKEVGWEKVSDPQYAWILGGIAILILLIACINYISLALTSSAKRRMEVGIRKMIGAFRKQLIYQFGLESVLLAFLSMVIGIGLVILFLPAFNQFTGKEIGWKHVNLVPLSLITIGSVFLVGLLAGCYPALHLSRFRPVQVLKGSSTAKLSAAFSKPLIVIQFALSSFLIISSVIMYRQMQFITTKDLGYDQHQLIVIPTQAGWGENSNRIVERFRQAVSSSASVVSVTGTDYPFAAGDYMIFGYEVDGESKTTYGYNVDPYYIKTLGIEMTAGRDFDIHNPADTSKTIIVNESLVRDMKWKTPIGEHLKFHMRDTASLGAKVIGVVKDFHFLSLQEDIKPMFLSMDRNDGRLNNILVKVSSENIPSTMEQLQKSFASVVPGKPFEYSFLDEKVALQYASYERWTSVMGLSTLFAILISCLGLFGLAGINAINKTREVGIRKVMGASLSQIFILLNKQFVWLSLISFVIAAPLSWYAMNKWLAGFQFKIGMSWELFAVSMFTGLMIAVITVSYHSLRAASVNPAETLKHE